MIFITNQIAVASAPYAVLQNIQSEEGAFVLNDLEVCLILLRVLMFRGVLCDAEAGLAVELQHAVISVQMNKYLVDLRDYFLNQCIGVVVLALCSKLVQVLHVDGLAAF